MFCPPIPSTVPVAPVSPLSLIHHLLHSLQDSNFFSTADCTVLFFLQLRENIDITSHTHTHTTHARTHWRGNNCTETPADMTSCWSRWLNAWDTSAYCSSKTGVAHWNETGCSGLASRWASRAGRGKRAPSFNHCFLTRSLFTLARTHAHTHTHTHTHSVSHKVHHAVV